MLEMGGYYNEADFNQLEMWAYENLFRGGGITQTDDGSIVLMAGSNLGGGTTVNWTNCLRTKPWVREQWEREFGLEGLAGPDYDRHLDAVSERINVNPNCSDWNGPHLRIKEGCEKLGYDFEVITRNADPSAYDPESAGYLSFGDQSGAKLGTLKTYLQDAADAGAQFVVNCRVDRVLVENGRAAGVEGTYTDEDGRDRSGHRARAHGRRGRRIARVAGACCCARASAGRHAGDYLRLHPASAVGGIYDEPQKGWWGPPQSGLSHQFDDLEDGYGFLIEGGAATPGLSSSARALGVRGRAQGADDPGRARRPASSSSSATAATAG